MTDTVRRGVDVSQWNARIDWDALAELCDFVVIRFTCGTRPDKMTPRHMEQARKHALCVGGYHFFRPHQDPAAQFGAFKAVDDLVGYESGDLVPWLDIEHDPGAPVGRKNVSPAWSDPACDLCARMVLQYGECMPYLNASDFLALGSPRWVVDRPLAVAHWTSQPQPTTPAGAEWVMWQRAVAPLPPASSLPIDQDVAKRLIHIPHAGPLGLTRGEVERVMGLVAMTAWDIPWRA